MTWAFMIQPGTSKIDPRYMLFLMRNPASVVKYLVPERNNASPIPVYIIERYSFGTAE